MQTCYIWQLVSFLWTEHLLCKWMQTCYSWVINLFYEFSNINFHFCLLMTLTSESLFMNSPLLTFALIFLWHLKLSQLCLLATSDSKLSCQCLWMFSRIQIQLVNLFTFHCLCLWKCRHEHLKLSQQNLQFWISVFNHFSRSVFRLVKYVCYHFLMNT